MQTKLTLRLEDHVIEQAKQYAAQAGKSVSQIVTDYFKLLAAQQAAPETPPPPITRSLRGLLRGCDLDKQDYRRFLEDKHR